MCLVLVNQLSYFEYFILQSFKIIDFNKSSSDTYSGLRQHYYSCHASKMFNFCRSMHLSCRSMHLSCRSMHLSCRSMHLSCKSMQLSCRSIHLICRSMHLSCRSMYQSCSLIGGNSSWLRHLLSVNF
jgi:hypothetical protein